MLTNTTRCLPPNLVARLAATTAVCALAISGRAYADAPVGGTPEPVVCSGRDCTITAVAPGHGQGSSSPPRPPVNTPSTAPRSPAPGSDGVSELPFLDQLLASGEGPLYHIGPNSPTWYLPGDPTVDDAPAAPPGVQAPVPTVSPAVLAQEAVSRLRLPTPVTGMDPGGDQTVNFPTWLWIQPTLWQPVSAIASVPGVSVTATARPLRVDWDMGDGNKVRCSGPGTQYSEQFDPAAPSPDCGYTYRRSSAAQPGEAYTVTATMTWTVSWNGAGQSGAFPGLQTATQVQVRVTEVQGVVVAAP